MILLLKLALFGIPIVVYVIRRSREAEAGPDEVTRAADQRALKKEIVPLLLVPLLAPVAIVFSIIGLGAWSIYLVLAVGCGLVFYSLGLRLKAESARRTGEGKHSAGDR